MGELLSTWIAAFLTLSLLSFLYKDNPFFRFSEYLFAGVSLGYYIGTTTCQTLKPNLVLPLVENFRENWTLVIPALLGINLYARYIKKIAWFSRISLAVYIGYYVGITMIQKLHGEVIPQVSQAIFSFAKLDTALVNNAVVSIGVLATLIYFFFSKEHKGVVGKISKVGVWYIMIAFGASFGYTVMARISLIIGRINFLVNDWIGGTFNSLF